MSNRGWHREYFSLVQFCSLNGSLDDSTQMLFFNYLMFDPFKQVPPEHVKVLDQVDFQVMPHSLRPITSA